MNSYPIKEINLDQWKKKVECTSMYTIPAEDQALPVLHELNEILTKLMESPVEAVIDASQIEYFFTYVFPTVCQKIIRSRYFKSSQVLKLSNSILQKSVCLTVKEMDIAIKRPKFLQVLTAVFSDESYFKTNNQMSHLNYPYCYFPNDNKLGDVQVGDLVDVLKIGSLFEKVSWSQGKIETVDQNQIEVSYLFDGMDKKIKLKRDSPQLAPHKTKSHTFEWRLGLKVGDLVDMEDSFGAWYNGTIVDIIDRDNGKKNVRVTLKVYHELGPKQDEKGSYFGFADYEQQLDFTSPKLAPYGTISKEFCYESSKTMMYDSVEDINDYEFIEINGQKLYALPRKKYLSEFQFQTINSFGQLGGFDKYIEYLETEMNFQVFGYFVKGISGVVPYLHRKIVKDCTDKLKVLLVKYLFENNDKSKGFSKQGSQMAFQGLKALQKRIYMSDSVTKYENNLKMKLVDSCLQSQAIKNKLQGLNELKEIVRTVTYANEKNKYIKQWVKNNRIFQKIYIVNSHVHLIKKSEQFFKYLITENILEVTDLQRLYKLAQKGDFQSRVALYKLFQEVSHIFKKQHVYFLIDTILESDLHLILNEDIDLLHELSRFSNYFPLEKVINFFENIILGDNKVKELNDYAIKKYSEIVAKNQDVKPHRRNIIKKFLQKLQTHDVSQVTKVLKGIFDGIGTGEWGKKDLSEIIIEDKVDEVVVEMLRKSKNSPQFNRNFGLILDFLLFLYKISNKIRINIHILVQIWQVIEGDVQKQQQFYKWANEVSKCDQGFENANIEDLQNFYVKLFTSESIPDMKEYQMQMAKNFFVQINKRAKTISVSTSYKEREVQKEYKRKVEMNSLRLIGILTEMVYKIKNKFINNQIHNFYVELYTSKENSQQEIDSFLAKLLKDFKEQYQNKSYSMLVQTIKLIGVVINDSQKKVQTSIKSLISKKQSEYAKFIIINEVSFISSDSAKKIDKNLPMNLPVIKLRKLLAKEFNLSWQEVKIVSSRQIEDYDNSRTLKQIKLNPNQPLTVSRRIVPSQAEQQLILNDEMSPKAARCFKVIFDKYSTEGKMDKTQCNSFTATCLGSACSTKYYNEKISYLYGKYDEDNDGLLTFENFLKFYQDAAKDRPSTVWSNLRSFGVRGDLKFNYEPEEQVEVTHYPRNIISEQDKVYDMLFDLLHIKEVAGVAFELLERLPVSKNIEKQLLNIESQQDITSILNTQDLYELFYKLNIIEYLSHSTELQTQAEKQWHLKFINNKGYEQLYTCLNRIIERQNESEQLQEIEVEIFETALGLLKQYWIECFSVDSLKTRLSLAFISADEDIDDKMDYLIFGRFFKSQRKITAIPCKIPRECACKWDGTPEEQIRRLVINQLRGRWAQVSKINKTQGEKIYILTMLLGKIIDAANVLYINREPHELTSCLSDLLDNIPSSDLIKKLYCLILSQCFYSSERNYQGVYVREMFKNLTKKTITSEHFRVLAVLVSNFGISTSKDQESEETIHKLTEILLENVLNNNNELTVEGCAKLLTNFSIQGLPFEIVEKIWDDRIFNSATICQKQQSKAALYELLLKICDNNAELTSKVIQKSISTLQQISRMKIVYCNEYKQRSSTGYAGLKNLGSTCYINSMLQQLYMNRTFRYCILRADDEAGPNLISVVGKQDQVRTVDDNFLHQLQRIFAHLQISNRVDFAPNDFCVAYKPFGQSVNVLIQQDVQEFVSMFFDRLEAGLSNTVFKKLVEDFYSGKTVNLFKCHSCSKTKKVEENFHSISLEVKTSKTLQQSLSRFCLGEMISDYKCDFCNNKVDVTKKTRISRAPKTLIIHLQRIVFNYDTFINQKITTKHSFPHNFNLYETTVQHYEKAEAGEAQPSQPPKQYQYTLIGIICHSGTADSGHYISYIKTAQNKWIEFNDSSVTPFNSANIESECFGGYFASTSFDDDYFDEKKESSKSAYLLIYEKEGTNTIELVISKKLQACKSEAERAKVQEQLLKTLDLKQVISNIAESENKVTKIETLSSSENTENATLIPTESHQESSSAPDDSEKQTTQLLEQKQLQIRRHQSQDNIDPLVPLPERLSSEQKSESVEKDKNSEQVVLFIREPISPYVPEHLKQQIVQDNEVHYFEKCLSSAAFAKFFALLVSKPHHEHQNLLNICQKLTFGFWLKSQSFKDLLNMLDNILKIHPQGFQKVITENPNIINLLIESSDSDVRSLMASFLAKVISDTIAAKNINIRDNKHDAIFEFLDKLFSLLPSKVSKCWTKFSQYFEFWYELSNKGEVLVEYMLDREIIKHFMDYFLDTKSPLKIYVTKRQHSIGSSYANPNFSMLLKCVFSLLQQRMVLSSNNSESGKLLTMSPDEQILLMSFEGLQKLISQNYQNIAAQLVKQICPNNLAASQKAAVVILKGINKSSADSIQPYLQVLHQFILINDQYQDMRIGWVVGKQTLAVSPQSQKIVALNSYSLDERIYNYESTLFVENGSSLLEPILAYYKRIETFALLLTRQVLRLCDQSKKLRNYIFTLSGPTLLTEKYVDFFKGFIQKYYEDHKKSYNSFYSSSPGFNREEFGKDVKELYEKIILKVQADQNQLKQAQQAQKNKVYIEEQILQPKQPEKQPEQVKNLIQGLTAEKPESLDKKAQQPPLNDAQSLYAAFIQYQDHFIEDLNVWQTSIKQQVEKANQQKRKISRFDWGGEFSAIVQDPWPIYESDEEPELDKQTHFIPDSEEDNQIPVWLEKYGSNNQSGKKQAEADTSSTIKQVWHPVKFEYTPIKTLQLPERLSSVLIQEHLSPVTYVLTRPTGHTNKSFQSVGGIQKLSQRILPQTFNSSQIRSCHGFYVKNSSRDSLRIQTNEGCAFCKSNENIFIWADEILKVWESERSIDWPKWKLYES